ncbi:TPA: hypothetical protein IUT95_002319 [Enterococcus faecalis]|uniref:hypothetical protein n=1 Tax=Enterococcus faecalis TaxID=1351 RepID=UPI001F587588|nr:hypothetical protein [Enterococcus faecalis]EKN1413218.1 hypothetical protein [Enterococcus faecalis]HAP3820603.1 hypothetical protein [Enterococcus faecalis]
MKTLKYVGMLLLAYVIYSGVYSGLTFSIPVFLTIFLMIIFWKISLKALKAVLFFVTFMFFQY